MSVELDYCEYQNDVAAQAAYISSDSSALTFGKTAKGLTGISGAGDIQRGCKFQSGLTGTLASITAYIKEDTAGAKVKFAIYDASLNLLANGTTEEKVVPEAQDGWLTFNFPTPPSVAASTNYWLVQWNDAFITLYYDAGSANQYGYDAIAYNGWGDPWTPDSYADRDWSWYATYVDPNLQCHSEPTIKIQGSYSLRIFARMTGSLNDTLTRTVGPTIDLTGEILGQFRIYSSRIGSNIKIGIHDSGGVTTETTPNIISANTWQTIEFRLPVTANKDAIDQIIITIVNADSDNTLYLDWFITTSTMTLEESLGLLESLPTIERQLTVEETIALNETITNVPACADVILEESIALAESFASDEQTIVRATATAEFLAEQAKRSNTPAKRIWLYINSSLYDITDKFMSMGAIDRKMAYKPGKTQTLTISDQNLVMSNADKYFSDLNPSSPFYNRDYAGADTIKVFAGFVIPPPGHGYAEVLEKADMKLIAIELATKEARAYLKCQDSFRDVFDTYVGMPTSEGVAAPLVYENKTFKVIMDDLLQNYAGIAAGKCEIEDVDLTFNSISFEKKKISYCIEKISEIARGTTVVLADGTVKFEQFISESIDPELHLESGKNFSTLQYLGSDARYKIKKVVVIGKAGAYGESSDTEGIELKIENDAVEDSDIAQAMADIYQGKFRIAPAEMKLKGEYLPSLDLKSIVEVTEPNSMMDKELLQVKELALNIVNFSTQLTLSVPGRFVGWTNTGGGDHGEEDWTIASDTEVGGVHTSVGTFKVNSGITATVKAFDSSTHGTFEIHAVDVDIDGAIVASEKGYGGGGAGGGGGGGRYRYGAQGSGGSGGSGVIGGLDGGNGDSGKRVGDEDIGGNGGAGGNGGGGTGAGIKGAGGIGAKGNVGVDHIPATAGGTGSNGGYGTVPNDNNDTSVDESLLRGKGGGAGGGGGGGDAEVSDSAAASGAGAGGGGAGGYGAGWIKLYATTSIDISGNIYAKGNSGGNGGNGGNGQSGTHPCNLTGGKGGNGGSAATAGTRLKGSGGDARWNTQDGADGGNGGHGAGGGLLLKCAIADAISVAGTLDNRGGGNATANGGTIKVFYAGVDPTGAGTWHYGRLYKESI